ncbi:nSTAND3 domain-containing NTPase [Collimonas humicola]|uniref:nSTAND3 domain-containing NTPase n=1 Tax=Collimonas humicola TaxID=2825886 RepID=UPI001B8AC20B|nr:restriction endonuclease [Collimonas humicola]
MTRYDFKSLSPQDFEELTRDLLQAEWGVTVEAFKTGRDQGIDLRYSSLDGGTTIVQCKHFAASTFSNLQSQLRNSELPKVQRLQPTRYLIVTSLGLSPADKDKVVETMRPFILRASDVIGAGDLDGLLARHPEIERANFKLWLTSTSVIERVLHNAEICHTQFEVERIRKKLPVFVQNKAYPRAQQILDEQRVAIISGVPGIGKTTLAEMLLYAHLDDGYEPIVVQSDISEGKKLFRSQSKQIFYYDDFLGQTFLGDQRSYLNMNQDVALLSFMEMVRSTPHSRFVLTTREHVLRQAFQMSERFFQSTLLAHKCVLELGDYSFAQRARILYNHLYFSSLPQVYKDVVLEDDFFLEIIKHEHFNPRLIEWLSSLTRLQSPRYDQYKQSITDLLQSPERLWSHAFETQISDPARNLLLTLYSIGDLVDIVDLEPAFEAIHQGACDRYHRPRSAEDFRIALNELDGAFLSFRFGRARFLNPSIRDFTAGVLCRTPARALDMVIDATRFKQLRNIWDLATKRQDQPLLAVLCANASLLRTHIERLMYCESLTWEDTPKGPRGRYVDSEEETRLAVIMELAESLHDLIFVDVAHIYAAFLVSYWEKRPVYVGAAVRTLRTMKESVWFWAQGGQSIYRVVIDGLLANINSVGAQDWITLLEFPDNAPEWTENDEERLGEGLEYYRRDGVDYDRDNCSDVSDLEALNVSLKELNERFGVDFARTIKSIESEIAEREERTRDDDVEGGGFSRGADTSPADFVTEEDVREMFKTLRE